MPDGHLYSIDEPPLPECPASFITPKSKEMLSQLQRVKFASDVMHGSLYGPILADWPPALVEATIALTSCENELQNAKAQAEAIHAKSPGQRGG